jgi:RTX calcium-binding nonapeptide repeat (4 copies)
MRIVAACALALLCPAAAQAATVRAVGAGGRVVVRDDVGERNRLEIAVGRTVLVRERGRRRLTAAGRCRQAGTHRVRCGGDVRQVRVFARGGDDRVAAAGDVELSVTAGAGNDRVLAGDTAAWLRGGPGADVLRGGPWGDFLFGGAGRDRLAGGGEDDHLLGDARAMNGRREGMTGDDVLAGGRGRDTASWEQRRTRVSVDLTRQVATSPGDADRLRSIESATGGYGADRLVGNGMRNRLVGGAGRDVLIGLAGDDHLDVTGRGLVVSPDGDGMPDRLGCGPGRDVVNGATAGLHDDHRPEPLGRDCEWLTDDLLYLDGNGIRVQPLRARRGRVRIPVVCGLEFAACRRRATLYDARGLLGRSRYVPVRPGVSRVTVRLRRPLPPEGLIDVRVRAPRDYGVRYRLRAP